MKNRLNFWLFLGVLLMGAHSVQAQQDQDDADSGYQDDGNVEEIVVLGTRRVDRTVTESAGPIDIFTPDQLNSSVQGDFRDTLRKTIPSFNVTRIPLSDAPSLARPATMRGLSPDHTLVLLNGTRRHRGAIVQYAAPSSVTRGSQPVDFGSIPSIGLGRLEVLRDGASAQYGSDAIAGVMNVQLREDVGVYEFRVGGGLHDRKNDGESNKLQVYTGFSIPRDGFLTFALEADSDELTSRGREHRGVVNLKKDTGFNSAKVFNDTRLAKPTAGGAAGDSTLAFGPSILTEHRDTGGSKTDLSSIAGFGASPINPALAVNPYSENYPTMTWGNPDTSNTRMLVNFGMQITPDARLYAYMTSAAMDAEIDFYWRTPINRGGIFNTPDIQRGRAVNADGSDFQRYNEATYKVRNLDTTDVPDDRIVKSGSRVVAVLDANGDVVVKDKMISETYTAAQHNALLYMDVRGLYPGGYEPIMYSETSDSAFTLGFDGTYEGWNYDVNIQTGMNTVDFSLSNSLNPSIYPVSGVGPGTNTEAEVGSTAHREDLASRAAQVQTEFEIGSLEQQESAMHIDFSKIYSIKSGELSLAWGVEGRRETYTIGEGEFASWGYTADETYGETPEERAAACAAERTKEANNEAHAVGQACNDQLYKGMVIGSHGLPGFSPNDAGSWSRNSMSAYMDLEIDLSATSVLGLAYRIEDYDDFGITKNAKISLRAAAGERTNWRTTISTGFRAPTLGQTWTSVTTTSLVDGELRQVGTLPASSPAARIKGSKPLEPETSRNFSFGFTGDMGERGGTWSLDFYSIRVNDRIAASGFLTLTQDEKDQLEQVIGPAAQTLGRLRYFTNDIDTETEGFDLVLSSPINDSWRYSLAYNRNRTQVREYSKHSGAPFSRREVVEMEQQTPKQRLNATFNFDSKVWGQEMSFRYYGRWADYNQGADTRADEFIVGKSALLVDMSWYVKIAWRHEIRLGADNLFDQYPNRINNSPNSVGHQYNDFVPYGYNGRFAYLRYRFIYEGRLY
ncbi:MAG: TonB-dependent receptor [Gammaproteobacteria bacterium AqS3]|nr:TonB-dependent receptor [Gammaproteobacteria bacterium AqS3]